MKKYAIIDSGTNTFVLNCYEVGENKVITKTHQKSHYVYLAEEGMGFIAAAACERALNAYADFAKIIQEQGIEADAVRAFGTAALRKASNGQELATNIKNASGLAIEIISGGREAELIFKGVAATLPEDGHYNLIMDIGGGSVEFILAKGREKLWAQSFELGGALLHRLFSVSDPLTVTEMQNIATYVAQTITPLLQQLEKTPVKRLLGPAGTLDAVQSLTGLKNVIGGIAAIPTEKFTMLREKIISSTLAERLAMPGMIVSRAKLLPVAMTLLSTLMRLSQTENALYASDYALHEGALLEIL